MIGPGRLCNLTITIAACVVLATLAPHMVAAQTVTEQTVTEQTVTEQVVTQPLVTGPTLDKLQEQIQNLKNPSYRTRQLAIWYLEQNPKLALPLLRAAGRTTDLNIGAEIVGMLSAQAMVADTDVSVEAHEALKEIAGGTHSVTAVSHLAIDALEGIADRQELLARQSLIDLNVEIDELQLNINGAMQNDINSRRSMILHVKDDFTGKDEHLRLFRFLRSVDSAYLEGPAVSEKMLHEVLAMPGIKRLVLKGAAVDNEMLQAIFDVPELDHLELVYAPVDDRALDTLVDLPLGGSLRLFGTKLSREGAIRLKKELDGLDIYIARGGFLGVQTVPTDLRVTKLVHGSGAEKAGILPGDIITRVNDKPVKIFEQLRAELSNFAPGEKVEVVLDRRQLGEPEKLIVEVTLGVQETQAN